MDYKEWKTSSRVMVLSGPPKCDLEQAASHVVHTLQEEKGAGLQPLLLHFFYRSAKYVPCPYIEPLRICWQDMVCKYTLLWQAIYDCPRPRQSLLKACLSAILANLDDNLIPGVLALTPTESLRRLLNAVTLEGFLVALLQALTTNGHLDAPNIGSGRPEQNTISQTSKTKRSLTFIFDLDYLPSETWKVLIDSIRQTMQTRQDVLTVKLLVTSPPIVATLGLQRLLDILLVYDEERQGLALPHFVNMILMATLTLTFVTLDCLKTLHFDNMQYEKISTQHENTFGWLWNNQRYQKWETSKRSNRLFIEGKPGSGKSTLVRYFRDQLPSRLSYGDSAIIAAFFYSQKDGNLGRSHCHMLRSLLYDILLADELFFIHFQQEYRRLKHPGSGSTTWRYEILKDILMKCAAHPLKTKLFLIIDALDESEIDNRRDVLLLLRNLSGMTNKKCMVKVFLASQPITELPKDFKLTCQHILLQERNRKDIEHYTQAFFDDQDFNVDQAIKTEAKNYIVAEAAGVFLWVRLIRDAMVGYINKGLNKSQILKFLKSLPKELESYYEHMLKGLNRGDQVDIRDGKRILQFCLFSDRVLELAELRHALAIPGDIGESFDPEPRARFFEDQMSINIRKRVTHCADNFVEIKNDHNQNFGEFFIDPKIPIAGSDDKALQKRQPVQLFK
jgi:hypothetical protein